MSETTKTGLGQPSPVSKDLQAQYEARCSAYNETEEEIRDVQGKIQTLHAQVLENETVKEELDMLDEDSEVFKSMGPVLMKVDLADAKVTVDQRLKHLEREMKNSDNLLSEKKKTRDEALKAVTSLQEEIQNQSAANSPIQASS